MFVSCVCFVGVFLLWNSLVQTVSLIWLEKLSPSFIERATVFQGVWIVHESWTGPLLQADQSDRDRQSWLFFSPWVTVESLCDRNSDRVFPVSSCLSLETILPVFLESYWTYPREESWLRDSREEEGNLVRFPYAFEFVFFHIIVTMFIILLTLERTKMLARKTSFLITVVWNLGVTAVIVKEGKAMVIISCYRYGRRNDNLSGNWQEVQSLL